MISFLTSIALDVSLGIAWWITKQVAYTTVNGISNGITYMLTAA